jgi:hypothetical protein
LNPVRKKIGWIFMSENLIHDKEKRSTFIRSSDHDNGTFFFPPKAITHKLIFFANLFSVTVEAGRFGRSSEMSETSEGKEVFFLLLYDVLIFYEGNYLFRGKWFWLLMAKKEEMRKL